jgi:ATP-binding cassette subfamily G (WHITE) protein 1
MGMTVICTIHSPSGDIFKLFDKVILLHDGHMIYQGKVKDLANHISHLGLRLKKFQNPADYMLKMT